MSIGIKIARFIAWVGAYERSFVIKTNFDYHLDWTCRGCGHIHSGTFIVEKGHRNPHPTSCYQCGVGHVVCIGGREWN